MGDSKLRKIFQYFEVSNYAHHVPTSNHAHLNYTTPWLTLYLYTIKQVQRPLTGVLHKQAVQMASDHIEQDLESSSSDSGKPGSALGASGR